MNALVSFKRAAALRPDQAALVQGLGGKRKALSFGELDARSARLAKGLEREGLAPGDRVLVFVPMSLDLYVLLLACFRSGLSAVFLDAWSDRRRLDAAVRAAAPRAAFLSPRAAALLLLSPSLRAVPRIHTVGSPLFSLDRFMVEGAELDLPELKPGQEAYVTFTTGSTGKPKGVPRSHAFLRAQAQALTRSLYWRPGSADFTVLPSFVLLNLALGVTSVLPDMDPREPQRADPLRQLALMEAEGAESASGSPAFFERVALGARKMGRSIPLKRLYVGGAAVPPALAKLLTETCEGSVQVVYGSTEAEPIAHASAKDLLEAARRRKPGLLAGDVRAVDLKILRAKDGPLGLGPAGWKDLELKRGQVGEIVVRGAHVQRGYLGDPEGERQNKIKDRSRIWHRSGDAGYLDPTGRLFLMGRLGQRVTRQGKTWWSLEAEQRALRVPGVAFAAYFGTPVPPSDGQAILCVEAPAVDAALEAKLRRALKPYPVDRCVVLDALPKDPRHGSKIDLGRLKAVLASKGLLAGVLGVTLALALGAPGALRASAAPQPQEIRLKASDGVDLRADWWHGSTPSPRIIVVLPGYAQHKGTHTMRYIAGELSPTADVLELDFRGTGKSGGAFTFGAEEPRDAQAALRWALDRYPDVTLLGFSLGSYTALRTSVEGPLRPKRALLVSLPVRLEQIISSGGVLDFWLRGAWQQMRDPLVIPEDADQLFRWGPLFLPKPKAPDLARKAALPLHLLCGAQDRLVYPSQSRRSFDAIPGPATWTLWPDGRHAEHMALKHPEAFAAWVRACMAWNGTGKAEDPFGVASASPVKGPR